MARDSRRRRRTRIAAGDGEPPPTSTSIHDLPDDLLELVLLHVVRTPFCLFRAMVTCKLWCRVIAGNDGGFLHRVHSLRRPNHLLGHYSVNATKPGFRRTVPEFVPFPARPAVDLRQRLSLDFLIAAAGEHMLTTPVLTDSRGGLLAFVHQNRYATVCDPWTRQYKVLDLPWARREEADQDQDRDCWYESIGAFILNADDGDEKSSVMSTFSVVCVCLITDMMGGDTATAEACIFSARDDGWIRSTVSSDVFTDVEILDMDKRVVGRAHGSIFFAGIEVDNYGHHALLVLEEATGDFSTITLPDMPDHDFYDIVVDRENLRVVNGGPGTLVRIIRLVEDDLDVLQVTRAHGGWECVVERCVGLLQLANIKFTANRRWCFLDTTTTAAAATATLVLGAFSPSSTLIFSLDVETMKMKRQRANKMTTTLNTKRVFPYELPWPQKINCPNL